MTKVSRSGQTKGIRAKGLVTEIEKDSFFVKIHPAGLEERTIKIENKKEHRYNSPSVITQRVSVIFLNENSLKGNYKNKEFNDPYDAISLVSDSVIRVPRYLKN